MNQTLANASTQSATGDAIPDSANAKFVRRASEAIVPVRFTVLEYGDYTKQVYDGDDRAKADRAWSGVSKGIFLGGTKDSAWITLGKR